MPEQTKSTLTNQIREVHKDFIDSKCPFPVISLSMNKDQLIHSITATNSIYNNEKMLTWISDKLFAEDNRLSLDDDDIRLIEKKFTKIKARFIRECFEDVMDELD